MDGVTMTGNTAGRSGGALCNDGGQVGLADAAITGNTASASWACSAKNSPRRAGWWSSGSIPVFWKALNS